MVMTFKHAPAVLKAMTSHSSGMKIDSLQEQGPDGTWQSPRIPSKSIAKIDRVMDTA